MLNPKWHNHPYEEDLQLWYKIENASPMFIERHHGDIDRLLNKYFVTEKWGGSLGPGYTYYQKIHMLKRAMESLEFAIPEYQAKSNEEWHEQRDREEDPGARLTREDEIEKVRRESSNRSKHIISRLQANTIDLGRFWINPKGEAFPVNKDIHHAEWIVAQTDLLDDREKVQAKKYADKPELFLGILFANGWIRISGFVAQMYSEFQMPNLVKFLKEKTFETEQDEGITIVYSKDDLTQSMSVGEVVSRYGEGDGGFELTGSVPNPLRRNYDYSGELGGPEWQSRVKHYMKLIYKKEAPDDKPERDSKDI